MSYWMGIDGGGSNLRVVITGDDLTVIAQSHDETANPSVVGRHFARQRILATAEAAFGMAGIKPADLFGLGIGVAGASVSHSEAWLKEVAATIAPNVPVALSSDVEIALVGAHGERFGVIIVAGTGSVAYGVNEAGESLQVGGWGYLIGDEGSSYWIGKMALQMLVRMADGRLNHSAEFVHAIVTALKLQNIASVLPWLYHSSEIRNREVAGLAAVVIDEALKGEFVANQIMERAAQELALAGTTIIEKLHIGKDRIALAGGLLERGNVLTQRLCDLLELPERPKRLYPPVIGAVLLAQLKKRDA